MPDITHLNPNELFLTHDNPRTISKKEFDILCKSLKDDPEFLERRPILVNLISNTGEKRVYAGNQRVLAAQALRWQYVPCILDVDLDDEIIKSRVIRDNRHNGNWDYDILANDWDLDLLFECGFDAKDFEIEVEKSESLVKQENQKCESCGRAIKQSKRKSS